MTTNNTATTAAPAQSAVQDDERAALNAALDARGDNRGQGLDPFWASAFREGWQARAASPQPIDKSMAKRLAIQYGLIPAQSERSLTDEQRSAVRDAIAEALGEAYDCMRVWSAWGVGTMGPNDFSLVSEDDDRLDEITDAAVSALLAAQTASGADHE